jgi:hypothetical protein
MKELSIVSFLIFCAHIVFLLGFNKYRIRRIVFFIERLYGEGVLSASEYDTLKARYSSFFKYMEPFPNFSNPLYESFKQKGQWILRYLFVAIPLLLIVNIVLIKVFS